MIMFPCSQCGECCRHIDGIPQLIDFDNGFGICIYLKDNICTIYENRPEVCRVDVMYEKYYSQEYSCKEFYRLNEMVCEELKNRK